MQKFVQTQQVILKAVLSLLLTGLLSTSIHADNFFVHQTRPAADIWTALRRSFRLPDAVNHPQVQEQIKWLTAHPGYIQKVAVQSQPYIYYVLDQIKQHNMPGEIALLPMIESAYDPFAYSGAGAEGLWQLMPGTGSGYGVKQNWWFDGRRDITVSTSAALRYLQYLNKFFNGNWYLAIAAYDSGEGTVSKAIKRNARSRRATDFWSLRLPRETRAYLPRLLAIASIIRHPNYYPVKLPAVPNSPYFDEVQIHGQLDLSQAAHLAELPVNEIYRLNPGYNRWATAPEGPHRLLLPIENIDTFHENYANLPLEEHVSWVRHKIETTQTLGAIANKYHTKVKLIKQVNHLKTDTILAGEYLLIPRSAKKLSKTTLHAKRMRAVEHAHQVGPQQVVHLCVARDTLWRLAQRYHVTANAIRYWNKMRASEKLQPGKQLIIWVPEKYARRRLKPRHYTVKVGDTLGHIARYYHVQVEQLKRWNHLSHGSLIRSGQRLAIYRT